MCYYCCGHGPVHSGTASCHSTEHGGKNVHTHVSIVQREGPGYALFSTDGSCGAGVRGSEGGCVHVC